MRIALMLAALLLLAPAARAGGKPSMADAKKAVQAWLDAEVGDDDGPAKAAGLSVTPFYAFAVIDGPGDPPCPESVATDAVSLAKSLACLHGSVQKDGKLQALTAKHRKGYGSQLRDGLKKLEATVKSATLVNLDMECAGTFNDVVLAVVKDKDGSFKIAGVMSINGDCGE